MTRIDTPLPQAPPVASPAAEAAIALYRRAFRTTDPRRRTVLWGRLDRTLTALSPRDTASYYRGIQQVRREQP
jgi:hypothetical protein